MTGNEDAPRPRFDTATGRKILSYDPYTGEPILEPEWRAARAKRERTSPRGRKKT
jgi:hypothetical protein